MLQNDSICYLLTRYVKELIVTNCNRVLTRALKYVNILLSFKNINKEFLLWLIKIFS